MSKGNVGVAIFNTHSEAENAVKELQKSGFDMKKLSIVGKDYHTEEQVVGYYHTGDRMKYWGKLGAFWGWPIWYFLRNRLLLDPRDWSACRSRSARRYNRWRPGGCRGSRRIKCAWRSSL